MLVRVLGISLAFIATSGALPILVGNYLPDKDRKSDEEQDEEEAVSRERCGSREDMAVLANLPKGHVYTFLDMAPRVLVMTPHTTVTGPYHRNHEAIVDNLKTLRAKPEDARRQIEATGAEYLLLCRGQLKIIGSGEDEQGLAWQLGEGKSFDWLEPIAVSDDNPNLLYRLKAPGSSE